MRLSASRDSGRVGDGAARSDSFRVNSTRLAGQAPRLWHGPVVDCDAADHYGIGIRPQTPEGRVLGLLPAVCAFAVFGYVTAAINIFRRKDSDVRLA